MPSDGSNAALDGGLLFLAEIVYEVGYGKGFPTALVERIFCLLLRAFDIRAKTFAKLASYAPIEVVVVQFQLHIICLGVFFVSLGSVGVQLQW